MTFESKVVWEDELDNIKEKGAVGTTMSELARHYNVSRQRMKQVVDRYIPNWGDSYGQAVKRSEKAQKWHSKRGDKDDSLLYALKREKFRRKKYNAERTGYSWNITFGELEWPTHCPILGIELDYQAEVVKENSVSFDRIDSSLGYESGNVIIISWRANRIKNNGTAEEHRKIADYLDSL
jgi:hypothetical protein